MQSTTTVEQRQRLTMRWLRHYVDKLPVTEVTAKALASLPQHSNQLPDRLEQLAAVDPTLAIRMLYLANHTFHGLHNTSITIGSLLTHVGASSIANGLTEFQDSSTVSPTATEYRDLWDHSIQVAAVAAHLTLKIRKFNLVASESYLAGLVHDLGRFIMLVASPGKSGDVSDKEWRNGEELLAAEMEVCGFKHTILGWLACRAWNFPDSIAAVCHRHHEWVEFEDELYSKRTTALIRIVGLADDIAFAWAEYKSRNAIEEALRVGKATLTHLYKEAVVVGTAEEIEGLLLRRS